ncbi:AsmA-like C-terminal region-containing protein [Acetobacter malorum]|uniref:AsmA family protein n=1 Tax=Acetobacter malorum TaxID=178901 RepID=UPI000776C5A4|nr:AsmA-like C-terminal region-containing protein [Acetobacter malorum]
MSDQINDKPATSEGHKARRGAGFWALWGGVGAVALIAASGGAGWIFLNKVDLGGFVARRATAALGRTVQVGSLHVTPGRWLKVEIANARLANIPGGTGPDMVRVGRLAAEVKASSLLHGPMLVRHVAISDVYVMVERTPQRLPNWRFGKQAEAAAKPAASHPPAGPDDRSSYPTALDVAVEKGEVIYRTAHGSEFRTTLKTVTLQTDGADKPVHLAVDGAYNDTPVTMTATMQPFSILRQTKTPYGIDMEAKSGDMTITFKGTATDPINADGIKGAVTFNSPTSRPMMQIAGLPAQQDIAMQMSGQFEHEGDLWSVTQGKGMVKDNPMTITLMRLVEGDHGKPDHVTADIAFSQLNLNEFLSHQKKANPSETDIPLTVDAAPDPLIDAHLSVKQLSYNVLRFSNMTLAASVKPGTVAVDMLALDYLGASLKASGKIEGADKGAAHVGAAVNVSGADIEKLRQALGFGPVPIAGRVDMQMRADATQKTLNAAVHAADVAAAVSMTNGSLDRKVIGLVSADLRMLFNKPKGMTPVSCMLGVVSSRGGVGQALPLRIRTGDGTVAANARFDLNRKWFDLTFGSQASTTGRFALDIPVRVSGSFSSPKVRPASWSAEGRAMMAQTDRLNVLPAGVKEFALKNACYRAVGK